MGSGSSKDASSSSSPSSPSSLRTNGEANKQGNRRRRRSVVMGSSCFGFAPPSPPPALQRSKQQGGEAASSLADNGTHRSKSDGGSQHVSLKRKSSPSEMAAADSSDSEGDQVESDALRSALSNATSSDTTTAAANQSSNPSSRSLAHFSRLSDGISLRLNRAVSLGSSAAHSILSSALPASDNGGGGAGRALGVSDASSDAHLAQRGASNAHIDSSLDMLRDGVAAQATAARQARRNFLESDNAAHLRHSNRRTVSQEPSEGSVRFSRTLSVGRLRDRVLRRTPFSEGLFTPPLLYDRSIWPAGNASEIQDMGSMQRTASSGSSAELQPDTSANNIYQTTSSAGGNHHPASETLREASNRDRSAFLERRRRIRSQVRALQRLGSRFENLSGHERSCILLGQHRTGQCTCRTTSRAGNSDEETSTRASISRIVMLAEALFEVLDEIHQQSVALSSRPSFSSIGSVPAPKEVVECLPVKVYRKALKHQNDEAAQCYICLVEYEEGDCVRILPCDHEFHVTCVDKWLKEIHRVCPLCRGDVCRRDAPSFGKMS